MTVCRWWEKWMHWVRCTGGNMYVTGSEKGFPSVIHNSDLSIASEVVLTWKGRGSVFPNNTRLPTPRAWSPMCQKPTIVGGIDAFQQVTLGPEAGDAIPLAVKHLQPGEDGGIQVRQPIIPYVQLGHVPQQIRLIGYHAGDLIQPDRRNREEAKVGSGSNQLCRLWPFLVKQGTCPRWWLIHCAAFWVMCSVPLTNTRIWFPMFNHKQHSNWSTVQNSVLEFKKMQRRNVANLGNY